MCIHNVSVRNLRNLAKAQQPPAGSSSYKRERHSRRGCGSKAKMSAGEAYQHIIGILMSGQRKYWVNNLVTQVVRKFKGAVSLSRDVVISILRRLEKERWVSLKCGDNRVVVSEELLAQSSEVQSAVENFFAGRPMMPA